MCKQQFTVVDDWSLSLEGHGGLEPIPAGIGQVASQSQGWHIETDNHSRSQSHLQAI